MQLMQACLAEVVSMAQFIVLPEENSMSIIKNLEDALPVKLKYHQDLDFPQNLLYILLVLFGMVEITTKINSWRIVTGIHLNLLLRIISDQLHFPLSAQ